MEADKCDRALLHPGKRKPNSLANIFTPSEGLQDITITWIYLSLECTTHKITLSSIFCHIFVQHLSCQSLEIPPLYKRSSVPTSSTHCDPYDQLHLSAMLQVSSEKLVQPLLSSFRRNIRSLVSSSWQLKDINIAFAAKDVEIILLWVQGPCSSRLTR